jgi:AAA15 family ATPase/GTPase
MPRLTSVEIRRFKQIQSLDLTLDNVNLLIGANNSGKSSILQAIHFGASIAQTARHLFPTEPAIRAAENYSWSSWRGYSISPRAD